MSNPAHFDTFAAEKVLPKHRALFDAILAAIIRAGPQLTPGMRGGTEKYHAVPVFRSTRDVIVISPSKAAITVSFAKGSEFTDPDKVLGGAGKSSRTIRYLSLDQFDEPVLAGFVKQAITLDLGG